MTTKHELWVTDDKGDRLLLLDNVESFQWNRVINDVGRCRVQLPGDFDQTLLRVDNHIEVWRASDLTEKLRLENAFFIRRTRSFTNPGGLTTVRVFGVDPNDFLKRRIVNYTASSAEARKTDNADDMMKAIVRENLGPGAGVDTFGATRNFDSDFFQVQADATLGPSITKNFSFRNVHLVLQDLSNAARQAGTEIYFAIVPVSPTLFEFQTYLDQPGQDRRFPDGDNPIIFSLDRGNLQQPSLEDDFEDEVNFVTGGGQGAGGARTIDEERDLDRINRSIWNRREAFRDARQENLAAGVSDQAQARLTEGLPKRRFATSLLSSENARYGIDWDFGDRITVEYLKQQFDAFIRAVSVNVDEEGGEIVEGRIEVLDVA